jgi:hypothetical protein
MSDVQIDQLLTSIKKIKKVSTNHRAICSGVYDESDDKFLQSQLSKRVVKPTTPEPSTPEPTTPETPVVNPNVVKMTMFEFQREIKYFEQYRPQGLEAFKANALIVDAHSDDDDDPRVPTPKQRKRQHAVKIQPEDHREEIWNDLKAESKCIAYKEAVENYRLGLLEGDGYGIDPSLDVDLVPTHDERIRYRKLLKAKKNKQRTIQKESQARKLESIEYYKHNDI